MGLLSIPLLALRWAGHALGLVFDWIIKVVPPKAWNFIAVGLLGSVVGWQACYVFYGVPSLKADHAALGPARHELAELRKSIEDGARKVEAQRQRDEARAWKSGFDAASAFQNITARLSPSILQVPYVISREADAACLVPWGVVRLWDAYATGADLDAIRARVAPGQPDDARSDVPLSEIATLLGTAAIRFHQNADQLNRLQAFEREAGQ